MIQPKIVIADYGVGNIFSISNALKVLGYQKIIVADEESVFNSADAILLPGVGAFDACMKNLKDKHIDSKLEKAVFGKKTPLLGICVGMQLLATSSTENGYHEGLNWIPGSVERLQLPSDFSVPHVGWNTVSVLQDSAVYERTGKSADFYFDHSYHYVCDLTYKGAVCSYSIEVTASVQKDNIYGVQFHPEKSQVAGLKLFRGFLNSINMLKKRIIASLVIKNGIVVQSIGYSRYLPVGKPEIAVEFLNQWGIDEIIMLDIDASLQGKEPDFDLVKRAAKKCFVPLTVGGGITKISQVRELMNSGADKVSFNRALRYHKELIENTAAVYGNQCVVASIDALEAENAYRVYDYSTKSVQSKKISEWAAELENMGAGELLVNSVNRDGSYKGFDIELYRHICKNVSIPVIAQGGAAGPKDFVDIFINTKVSAAAAANFFHFYEHSVILTKAAVGKEYPIRLETFANYDGASTDQANRLLKLTDAELEKMLYLKIEKEII